MAAANFGFTYFIASLANKLVDLDSDALTVMLLDNTSTPDTVQDTAQFVDDVLAVSAEISGAPYVAGGLALASVTFTTSGGVWTLDCDDPTWGAGAVTASFALVYDSTPGSDATNPVICYLDFGGDVTLDPFSIPINEDGLVHLGRT